jgi:hypothetical protein
MHSLLFAAQILGLATLFLLAVVGVLSAIASTRPQPWEPEMPDNE